MLTHEIVPGNRVGPFELGMHVSECVKFVREKANMPLYSKVDLVYNEEDMFGEDLCLDMPNNGMRLCFDSRTQLLAVIDIYDLKRQKLSYIGTVFNGPTASPSFVDIYRLLGITQGGSYDPHSPQYILRYPGIVVWFDVPNGARKKSTSRDLPIELSDGSSPTASRIQIQSQNPHPAHPSAPRSPYKESAILAKVGVGIQFLTGQSGKINIGSTLQDALHTLGSPTLVLQKNRDQMLIHAVGEDTVGIACADYMYCYQDAGLDILFDAVEHTVKKFVLHTNVPGHTQFGIYRKCMFVIEKHRFMSSKNSPVEESESLHAELGDLDRFEGVLPEMRWEQVQDIMGSPPDPLINDHGRSRTPFGPSYYYGYHRVIFEVTKHGYLASVTLF